MSLADDEAFEAFVRAHGTSLVRLAGALTGDPGASEDRLLNQAEFHPLRQALLLDLKRFYEDFLKFNQGGDDPKDAVRAIAHVRDLVGIDHVGLGSDFDGSTTTGFDARARSSLLLKPS